LDSRAWKVREHAVDPESEKGSHLLRGITEPVADTVITHRPNVHEQSSILSGLDDAGAADDPTIRRSLASIRPSRLRSIPSATVRNSSGFHTPIALA
jgi:hypothetical protein